MQINYFFTDVDGTLTDGMIYMGIRGESYKAFNIKDGYGIHDILLPKGIIPVIITGRTSEIVINRSKELGIEKIYQSVRNKLQKVNEICKDLSQAAYIGDDINDLECMTAIKEAGGIIGCPADAAKEIIQIADFISTHEGGKGAVRDFIDFIVSN